MTDPNSEEWRPVAGHPAYEVSNHGRIRRVEMVVRNTLAPPTVLRSALDRNGRSIVRLRISKTRQRNARVNVAVFRAFVGELPKKFRIDHIDGNFLNCRPENLRIADRYIPAEDDMRLCGKKFGHWTALRRAGKDKYGNAMWLCRCICGAEKRVHVGDLRRGMSRNCGCKTGELQNLKGDRNPSWRGGRSRDPETHGTYAWCQAKLNGINNHARKNGYAKVAATVEDIIAMWTVFGGACAVCRTPPRDKRSLHLDHDHSTGKVRGFLCNHCNVSIGMARESADLLRRLADYLEAHQKPAATE
jgi:hypothetical protein